MADDGTRCVRNFLRQEAYEMDDQLESLSRTFEWSMQQPRTRRTLAPPCSPPPELVEAVLKGIRAQMKEDGEFRAVNASDAGASPKVDEHLEDFAEDFSPSNEQRTEGQEEKLFYDDLTGVQLDTQGVLEARRQELARVHKAEVYTKRTLEECCERTGKAPI